MPALLLLVVLAFSALLTLVQTFVTELIQQRIFVRFVIDIAERIPRVQPRAFDRQHGPELVNRVFEVVSVQKALSTLLLEGTSAVLQIAVGLLVLSFYHPLMLGFSFLLIVGTFLVVVVMGRNAVGTAIEESRSKYDVFGWLQELARHPATFRDANQRRFASGRIDTLAAAWVGARREHFRILLRQHGGALGLQVVASAALLALGGMLVVQGQLTLGQLVASEIIITTIVSAVAKFGKQLERFYDLLAAMDKLSLLIDLPLEREGGTELATTTAPAAVELVDVEFGYSGSPVFSAVDLRIEAGERVAIEGGTGSGKSSLLDLLFCLREPTAGYVALDGRDYRDLSIESIRDSMALIRGSEIFAGTIRENVRVGQRDFDDEGMLGMLDAIGMGGEQGGIVGDHDHRARRRHPAQQRPNPAFRRRIDVGGRLVQQQQRRIGGQRAGQQGALQFAPRQLAQQARRQLGQFHLRQRRLGALPVGPARATQGPPAVQASQPDEGGHGDGQMPDWRRLLGDIADAVAHLPGWPTQDVDVAGIGAKDAGQQLDQAALARAIGTENAEELPRRDIEIKALQHGSLAGMSEAQPPDAHRRVHGRTAGWARARTRARTLPK